MDIPIQDNCLNCIHKNVCYKSAWQTEPCKDKIEEKPQGEWIYDNKINNWKCSVCLETPKTIGYVGNRDFMNEHFKYCNHCGTKMKQD